MLRPNLMHDPFDPFATTVLVLMALFVLVLIVAKLSNRG